MGNQSIEEKRLSVIKIKVIMVNLAWTVAVIATWVGGFSLIRMFIEKNVMGGEGCGGMMFILAALTCMFLWTLFEVNKLIRKG